MTELINPNILRVAKVFVPKFVVQYFACAPEACKWIIIISMPSAAIVSAVDMVRQTHSPSPSPLGAIFALKYLKMEAKLGKNGRKWSNRPPPLEGESKNPHPS